MFDTTIHAKTLERHLLVSDFLAEPTLKSTAGKKAVIERAAEIGQDGYTGVVLRSNDLRGKKIYQFSEFSAMLVARHLGANITRITNSRQDNRNFIVECIISMCRQAIPFNVFKFDIHKFYDSIDVEDLIRRLDEDVAFSGQSARLVRSLLENSARHGVVGLPRGLAISAVLSEYLMRHFDRSVSNIPNIWFYARFVDDIIIFAHPDVSLHHISALLSSRLPPGLRFNHKTSACTLTAPSSRGSASRSEAEFNFLGYKFQISECYRDPSTNRWTRKISVDISDNKTKRFKTRIAKSLHEHSSGGSYTDLLDRIRLLTSNYSYHDHRKGYRRKAGIYFSYPFVDAATSANLTSLDRFLTNAVTSTHRLNRLRPSISPRERNEILRLGFREGFVKKRFFSFSPSRLSALKAAWEYA